LHKLLQTKNIAYIVYTWHNTANPVFKNNPWCTSKSYHASFIWKATVFHKFTI